MRNKNTDDLCDVFPPYSSSSSSPSSPCYIKCLCSHHCRLSCWLFVSFWRNECSIYDSVTHWSSDALHRLLNDKLPTDKSFWDNRDEVRQVDRSSFFSRRCCRNTINTSDVIQSRSSAFWSVTLQSIWTKQANRNITSQPVKRAKK